MPRLQPIGLNVFVRRNERPHETRSGLILPDTWEHKNDDGSYSLVGCELSQRGTVVAVGSRVRVIEPGASVIFSKFHDRKVVYNGEELLTLREDELLMEVIP